MNAKTGRVSDGYRSMYSTFLEIISKTTWKILFCIMPISLIIVLIVLFFSCIVGKLLLSISIWQHQSKFLFEKQPHCPCDLWFCNHCENVGNKVYENIDNKTSFWTFHFDEVTLWAYSGIKKCWNYTCQNSGNTPPQNPQKIM